MTPRINFANLVRQLIPAHKRQPARLAVLRSLIAPIDSLYAGFEAWCDRIRIEINMTSQVGVLEGYLCDKYGSRLIHIESYADGGLSVGMEYEGDVVGVPIGLSTSPASVPLEGETTVPFDDADFIVYIPSTFTAAQIEDVRLDVERYKQVLANYKIINK